MEDHQVRLYVANSRPIQRRRAQGRLDHAPRGQRTVHVPERQSRIRNERHTGVRKNNARRDRVRGVRDPRLQGRRASRRARLSEEQVERLLAVSVVRPDDPFALMVDDHGDARVPLPVAGLVHCISSN